MQAVDTSPSSGQSPPSKRGKRLVQRLVLFLLFALAAAGGVLTGLLLAYQRDLPLVEALEDYRPSIITQVFSDEDKVIAEFAVEKRVVISEIPERLKKAFIAAEDQHFYRHPGVDPVGISRAAYKMLIHRRIRGGGSTITQQLARGLFLTPAQTFERKVKEAILAFQIEKNYTKEEILTLYCNHIHLGHGSYGVEAAAQLYFGKGARDLSLEEAALIAGITPRASRYSPFVNPERALERRDYVLRRMREEGYISEEEEAQARQTPVKLKRRSAGANLAPYFVEEVRRYLQERYGSQRIYRGGLRVYTTLNESMQHAAEKALEKALRDVDKRQGFRPVAFNVHRDTDGTIEDYRAEDWSEPITEGEFVTGVVTEIKGRNAVVRIGSHTATLDAKAVAWTKAASPAAILKVGDVTEFRVEKMDSATRTLVVTLDQEPVVEGAFLALDTRTGQIKAMVGGLDFDRSEFNRATQARRQPGSAFKPFAYATAIDSGFTATSLILDAPVRYEDPTIDEVYEPSNYDEKYEGWVTLRHALEASRNVPAVRLTEQISPARVADMARRLGLSGPVPPYLSLPLGSAEATLLEMVSAYSTFANQGIRMRPYFVAKVTDRDGNLLEETHPEAASAIRADTAYIITNLLKGVVQRGTAARAARLGRPLAGKTGTTNDYTDAWFIGYDPRLAAGVWVGFDQKRSLGDGEVGARTALPAWIEFMETVLADQPVEDFPIPSNIVFVPVDRHTGYPSTGAGPDVIMEAFIAGTEPAGYPES
ncbi:MAG: penicillin-binding protein 1A [Acidobacteriota bacterium]